MVKSCLRRLCLCFVFLVPLGVQAEKKFAYIAPGQSETWQVATRMAAERFAADLGVELIVLDPHNSAAEQVRMARDIAPQIDGAVVIPVDSSARLIAKILKEDNPNRPVVLIDRDIPSEFADLFIAFGNKSAGAATAEELVKLLIERNGAAKGKIVLMTGDLSSVIGQERRDGALEVFARYPEIKVVNVIETPKWSQAVAQERIVAELAARGRPDAILCNFDGAAIGSVNALRMRKWLHTSDSAEHVIIGTIDASTVALKYVREGLLDFAFSQPNLFYGPVGIYYVNELLKNGEGILPKVGSTVTEEALPIGTLGKAHGGVNPWTVPFWAPAKVVDRPKMKHPQLLMKGSLVTKENADAPYFWGNVIPLWK